MASVVVIEDEPHIATLVAVKFRNAGHQVEIATDGEAGLDLVLRREPEVVLLDVMMPKMDGFEVCQAIREHFDETQRPTVVLLSARSQLADRQRGIDAGCDDYIVKPFRPAALLDRVTELLKERESQ
ncbi:MAG TPA: response regulator [Thermomicrobiales bacterium]|nr:response regulator [Thermomicrobiales bacterium]